MPDSESSSVKTTRIRLIYEKRGRACFVPHVALSTLFARAARRAGMELSRTEGFSPHAKISFGPELPAGVAALNEPVDMWLKTREDITEGNRHVFLDSVIGALNSQMPEGFRVTKCIFPAEGAGVLGKECKAAHYLVWTRNEPSPAELLSYMERHYREALLNGFIEEYKQAAFSRISAVLADPAQNGIGGLVKALVADRVIAGWHDMCVVRMALGRWNGERVEPI